MFSYSHRRKLIFDDFQKVELHSQITVTETVPVTRWTSFVDNPSGNRKDNNRTWNCTHSQALFGR